MSLDDASNHTKRNRSHRRSRGDRTMIARGHARWTHRPGTLNSLNLTTALVQKRNEISRKAYEENNGKKKPKIRGCARCKKKHGVQEGFAGRKQKKEKERKRPTGPRSVTTAILSGLRIIGSGRAHDYPDDLSTMVHGWLAVRQVELASKLEALGEGLRGGQVRKRRRVRSPGRAREEVKPKERADERRWSAGDARLACAGLRTRYSTRCYQRSARVEQPSPAVVATPDTTRMLSPSEREALPSLRAASTTIDARSGWTWRTTHAITSRERAPEELRIRGGPKLETEFLSSCWPRRFHRQLRTLRGQISRFRNQEQLDPASIKVSHDKWFWTYDVEYSSRRVISGNLQEVRGRKWSGFRRIQQL